MYNGVWEKPLNLRHLTHPWHRQGPCHWLRPGAGRGLSLDVMGDQMVTLVDDTKGSASSLTNIYI